MKFKKSAMYLISSVLCCIGLKNSIPTVKKNHVQHDKPLYINKKSVMAKFSFVGFITMIGIVLWKWLKKLSPKRKILAVSGILLGISVLTLGFYPIIMLLLNLGHYLLRSITDLLGEMISLSFWLLDRIRGC